MLKELRSLCVKKNKDNLPVGWQWIEQADLSTKAIFFNLLIASLRQLIMPAVCTMKKVINLTRLQKLDFLLVKKSTPLLT